MDRLTCRRARPSKGHFPGFIPRTRREGEKGGKRKGGGGKERKEAETEL